MHSPVLRLLFLPQPNLVSRYVVILVPHHNVSFWGSFGQLDVNFILDLKYRLAVAL